MTVSDKKIIIFDFDGTLADTAPIIRAIYTEMATKGNLTTLTDEAFAMLRQGSLREAKKWSGVRFWQFPLLARSAQKLMKLEAENVNLFPGIAEMIRALRAQDLELYVLSRNSSITITHVFERHGVQDDFEILRRHKRSFGSKAAVINSLIRKKRCAKQSVWMVGDEVRDILAAKRAGVNSIAVSWGLQDTSILKRYQPTYLVSTVEQLQKILLGETPKGE